MCLRLSALEIRAERMKKNNKKKTNKKKPQIVTIEKKKTCMHPNDLDLIKRLCIWRTATTM